MTDFERALALALTLALGTAVLQGLVWLTQHVHVLFAIPAAAWDVALLVFCAQMLRALWRSHRQRRRRG